jgi:gluconolactonase
VSLFPPPAVIGTRVFTRMPDGLRRPVRTAWADANKAGEPVGCFLEGPCFDAQGNLWCTDIPHGRIFRIDPKGEWTMAVQYDGEPNGMKVRRDGTLLVTDYRRGLLAIDPRDGRVEPVLARRHSESFRGLNDLCIAANGDVYFTDQGQTGLHDPSGRVYRLCADGRVELLLANVPSPNGVVLDPAEKVLFVAATRGNDVWRVPLQPDGGVSKVGRFVSLSGTSGPDGLAMLEDGSLCVAHVSLGAVFVFAPSSEPRWRIASCAGSATTNVVFGGPDRRTIYITESETGSILQAELPVAGKRLP